jgi:hypothetical protein
MSSLIIFNKPCFTTELSTAFHEAAIREMCRVAAGVRIFLLLEPGARPFRHPEAVTDSLGAKGYEASITPVAYEFQRGGNELTTVKGRTCPKSVFWPNAAPRRDGPLVSTLQHP